MQGGAAADPPGPRPGAGPQTGGEAARLAYTLLWILALPLVAGYLLWRSRRQPEYRRHWAERFLGRGAAPAPGADAGPVFWIHAVSLGETRAAQPLVEEMARRWPHARFVLTHMTPTGREAGAVLLARPLLQGRGVQRYLPYDLPWAVARFFRTVRPAAGLLLETEIWPNLLAGAQRAGVPVALVNARLSERSLARADRYAGLMRGAAARVSMVVAQTRADALRISRLRPGEVRVAGNLKFDLRPDPVQVEQGRRLRLRLGSTVQVQLFASTREGEEALLLEAVRARAERPGAQAPLRPPLRVLVPRHPQRFDEVAALLAATGRPVLRRSAAADEDELARSLEHLAREGGWLLGDSMGEMPWYFALADVALIGGSLAPLGGQNLIEACACGCPVLVGPHTFNFAQATEDAIAAGAALRVADAHEAVATLDRLCADERERAGMAGAAQAYAGAHRGATTRTIDAIASMMGPGAGST